MSDALLLPRLAGPDAAWMQEATSIEQQSWGHSQTGPASELPPAGKGVLPSWVSKVWAKLAHGLLLIKKKKKLILQEKWCPSHLGEPTCRVAWPQLTMDLHSDYGFTLGTRSVISRGVSGSGYLCGMLARPTGFRVKGAGAGSAGS